MRPSDSSDRHDQNGQMSKSSEAKSCTEKLKSCVPFCSKTKLSPEENIEEYQNSVNESIRKVFEDRKMDVSDSLPLLSLPQKSGTTSLNSFPVQQFDYARSIYSIHSNYFVYWTDCTIFIYKVDNGKLVLDNTVNEFRSIAGEYAVQFFPSGMTLIIVETTKISRYMIGKKTSSVLCETDMYGQQILWSYFRSSAKSAGTGDYPNHIPDYFMIASTSHFDSEKKITLRSVVLSEESKLEQRVNINKLVGDPSNRKVSSNAHYLRGAQANSRGNTQNTRYVSTTMPMPIASTTRQVPNVHQGTTTYTVPMANPRSVVAPRPNPTSTVAPARPSPISVQMPIGENNHEYPVVGGPKPEGTFIHTLVDFPSSIERTDKTLQYYSENCETIFQIFKNENSIEVKTYPLERKQDLSWGISCSKTKTFPKRIVQSVFTTTDAQPEGLLMASDPLDSIYLLRFKDKGDVGLEELFKVPASVQKINHISGADNFKFIIMNCNEKDLLVYSRLNDGKYGMIYYNTLVSEETKCFVSEDLDYIFEFTWDQIQLLPFAPYEKPFKYYLPTTREAGDNRVHQNQNSFPINSRYAVILRPRGIALDSLYSGNSYLPENSKDFPQSINMQKLEDKSKEQQVLYIFKDRNKDLERECWTLVLLFDNTKKSTENPNKVMAKSRGTSQVAKEEGNVRIARRVIDRKSSTIVFVYRIETRERKIESDYVGPMYKFRFLFDATVDTLEQISVEGDRILIGNQSELKVWQINSGDSTNTNLLKKKATIIENKSSRLGPLPPIQERQHENQDLDQEMNEGEGARTTFRKPSVTSQAESQIHGTTQQGFKFMLNKYIEKQASVKELNDNIRIELIHHGNYMLAWLKDPLSIHKTYQAAGSIISSFINLNSVAAPVQESKPYRRTLTIDKPAPKVFTQSNYQEAEDGTGENLMAPRVWNERNQNINQVHALQNPDEGEEAPLKIVHGSNTTDVNEFMKNELIMYSDDDLNDSFDEELDNLDVSALKKNSSSTSNQRTLVALFKYQPDGKEPFTPVDMKDHFSVTLGMEYMRQSVNGKYMIFYGKKGYELFINRGGNPNSGDTPKYVSIRRRRREKYKIDKEDAIKFSPDERYLAVAFAYGNKTVLLNLNEENVTSETLTRSTFINELSMYFKFYSSNDKKQMLAICDYQNDANSIAVKVYDLQLKVFSSGAQFSSQYIPTNLDIVKSEKKESNRKYNVYSLHVLMTRKWEVENHLQTGFYKYELIMHDTSKMPFHNILTENFVDYFHAGTEIKQLRFDMLVNTYKAMKSYQMVEDIRVPYTLFVLNRPDVFMQVFSKEDDLNTLLSVHRLLELIYSSNMSKMNHSVDSLSKMFGEMISKKKYPRFREEWLEDRIEKYDPEGITNTPGNRAIFTNILFSKCHITINGLVEDRYNSLKEVNMKDHTSTKFDKLFIEKEIAGLMLENPNQSNDYEVYRTRIHLELTNGSQSSINLMQIIQQMPDDDIRYKYKQIINYKWNMVWWYSLIYTILYLILNVVAYFFFGYYQYTWMGIIIIVLNCLFLLFEFKCLHGNWRMTLKDLINWIDLAIHGGSILGTIFIMGNIVPSLNPYINLIMIFAISARGIVLLKMFSSIRILVMLLGEIIWDLRYFPLLLGGVLILAGTMYKVAPLPGGNADANLGFFEALQEVFLIMFMGAKADNNQVNDKSSIGGIIRSIILVLGGTMLAQGIFNFIIAIFLQTFKKVNSDREVYELKSLILDIQDFDLFLRGFESWTTRRKHHFLILVPVPKDGKVFENLTQFDKVQSLVHGVMVEAGKKGMEKLGDRAKDVFGDQATEIDAVVDTLKDNTVETSSEAKQLFNTIQKLTKGDQLGMEDLNNITNTLASATKDNATIEMIRKAQDQVTSMLDIVRKLNNGYQVSMGEILGLINSMAKALGPQNYEFINKIQALTDLADNTYNMVENSNADDPRMITDALHLTAQGAATLINNPDITTKLVAISDVVRTVTDEAVSLQSNNGLNLTRIMESTSNAFHQFGGGDSRGVLDKISKVTDAISVMTKEVSNIKSDDPDPVQLVKIGGEVVKKLVQNPEVDLVVDVSVQFIDFAKNDIYEKLKSGENIEVGSVVSSSGAIMERMYPETKEVVRNVSNVVIVIEKAVSDYRQEKAFNLVSMVEAVRPLIAGKNEKVDKAVKGIEGIITLIQRGLEDDFKIKNVDFEQAVRTAGDLIKIVVEDPRLNDGIDKSAKIAGFIQTVMENSNKSGLSSIDPEVACVSATEIICILKPEYNTQVRAINQSIVVLMKQAKKYRKEIEVDIQEVVNSTADLATTFNPRNEHFFKIFKSSTAELLVQYKKLREGRLKTPKDYVEACGALVISISPNSKEDVSLLLECLDILQQVSWTSMPELEANRVASRARDRIEQEAQRMGQMSFGPTQLQPIEGVPVQTMVVEVETGDANEPKRYVEVPVPGPLGQDSQRVDHRIIESRVQREVQRAVNIKIDKLLSITARIASKIDKKYGKHLESLHTIARSMDSIVESLSTQGLDPESLENIIKALGEVMKEYLPKSDKAVTLACESAAALRKLYESTKDKDRVVEVAPLVQSIANIVNKFDNKYKKQVDTLVSIVVLCQTQARQLKLREKVQVGECVELAGEIIIKIDGSYQPVVAETVKIVKVIDSFLYKYGSGEFDENDACEAVKSIGDLVVRFRSDLAPAVKKVTDICKVTLFQAAVLTDSNTKINLQTSFTSAKAILLTIDPSLARSLSKTEAVLLTLESQLQLLTKEDSWTTQDTKKSIDQAISIVVTFSPGHAKAAENTKDFITYLMNIYSRDEEFGPFDITNTMKSFMLMTMGEKSIQTFEVIDLLQSICMILHEGSFTSYTIDTLFNNLSDFVKKCGYDTSKVDQTMGLIKLSVEALERAVNNEQLDNNPDSYLNMIVYVSGFLKDLYPESSQYFELLLDTCETVRNQLVNYQKDEIVSVTEVPQLLKKLLKATNSSNEKIESLLDSTTASLTVMEDYRNKVNAGEPIQASSITNLAGQVLITFNSQLQKDVELVNSVVTMIENQSRLYSGKGMSALDVKEIMQATLQVVERVDPSQKTNVNTIQRVVEASLELSKKMNEGRDLSLIFKVCSDLICMVDPSYSQYTDVLVNFADAIIIEYADLNKNPNISKHQLFSKAGGLILRVAPEYEKYFNTVKKIMTLHDRYLAITSRQMDETRTSFRFYTSIVDVIYPESNSNIATMFKNLEKIFVFDSMNKNSINLRNLRYMLENNLFCQTASKDIKSVLKLVSMMENIIDFANKTCEQRQYKKTDVTLNLQALLKESVMFYLKGRLDDKGALLIDQHSNPSNPWN